MNHPPLLELLQFAQGFATPSLREHVENCRACSRKLSRARTLSIGIEELRATHERTAEPHGVRRLNRLQHRWALSREAQELAGRLVKTNDPAAAVVALRGNPCRGYALVYAASGAAQLAVQDPHRALALAEAIRAEADVDVIELIDRSEVRAEASILASRALLNIGRVQEALDESERARQLFRRRKTPDPFSEAICDYFSANALSYKADYRRATQLLKRARRVFEEFGQDAWIGRVELCIGTVLAQQGRNDKSLPHFQSAEALLDRELDSNSYAVTLLNKGNTLAHLSRFDEARSAYAEALGITRRHGYSVLTFAIRLAFAELEFLHQRYERALQAFAKLAREAEEASFEEQIVFATLYVAECQARLGRTGDLARSLADLRSRVTRSRFSEPALEELFSCFDAGDIDAGLIEHVRDALAEPARPYERYRRVS